MLKLNSMSVLQSLLMYAHSPFLPSPPTLLSLPLKWLNCDLEDSLPSVPSRNQAWVLLAASYRSQWRIVAIEKTIPQNMSNSTLQKFEIAGMSSLRHAILSKCHMPCKTWRGIIFCDGLRRFWVFERGADFLKRPPNASSWSKNCMAFA